jgi:hypothetical protein
VQAVLLFRAGSCAAGRYTLWRRAPDLPPDFRWPEREVYPHGQHLAPQLGRRGEGFAKLLAWTMLLQVDMASLGTDFAEGTVYFVMRADDLERREFSINRLEKEPK